MKKFWYVLLVVTLLLATSVVSFADEVSTIDTEDSISIEVPVDVIMNEGYEFEFTIGNGNNSDYSTSQTRSTYSRIRVSIQGHDWAYDNTGDLYAVMTIKAKVLDGANIKRFYADAYVYPTDMSTYYSYFDVRMYNSIGANTLSDEYSAWVPEGETSVRVELENIWAENVYGIDGEFDSDYRIVLYR